MSYEVVINGTKKIEGLLMQLGASGRGLHEKVTSIEASLSVNLVKRVRFIATVRNKLIHDSDTKLTPSILSDFKNACDEAERELTEIIRIRNNKSNSSSSNSNDSDDWIKVAVGVGAAIAAVYTWLSK